MLVPAVQQVFGSLAILSLLFPSTIIPSISARQIPLHPDGGAKERVPLENIPSLGLGLWNSEGENVSPCMRGSLVLVLSRPSILIRSSLVP